ncbi:hypothetical protein [Haladaptatus sp. ZSTT2]|uniref:hypothetical protein n=1 Tax=Haladaptatus sp. ZSTT2 TaxID=3120515 RepID=UPI00300E7BF7
MPSFGTRVMAGLGRAQKHLLLALVPLTMALMEIEKIQQIVAHHGMHVSFRVSFPSGVITLWTFVEGPTQGLTVDSIAPTVSPMALVLPGYIVIQAALTAGYFGSLADALETGAYDFFANVRRYFVQFLVYTLLPMVLIAPLLVFDGQPLSSSLTLFFVLFIPIFFALTYLFYATPYLVVLRETDIISAAKGAYGLALDGGAFWRYTLGFVALSLLASAFISAFVVNLGLGGIIFGVLILSPVGLGLNFATMHLIADIDPHSPSYGSWDAADAGARSKSADTNPN